MRCELEYTFFSQNVRGFGSLEKEEEVIAPTPSFAKATDSPGHFRERKYTVSHHSSSDPLTGRAGAGLRLGQILSGEY